MTPPVVSFRGQLLPVRGLRLTVGDVFPDSQLLTAQLETLALSSVNGVRLISVIPSLDTQTCNAQTRRFDAVAKELGDRLHVITISTDLPFAIERWKTESGLTHTLLLSDHRNLTFGDAIGAHIESLRLLQRCVFVIGADDLVHYAEYVPVFGQHPDYDAAVAAANELIGRG